MEQEEERTAAPGRGKQKDRKRKRAGRGTKNTMNAREIEKWSLPFSAAYDDAIKRRHEFNGQLGPLDLCSPHKRRLMMIWMANPGIKPPWDLLCAFPGMQSS